MLGSLQLISGDISLSKLNVLVLHKMGDPRYWRECVRSLEFMIPECAPNVNCIVHDSSLPFPEQLKDLNFHLIVMGPTFLCNRHSVKSYERVKRDYDFIRESNACKVALPQDDYDSSAYLDSWLTEWEVDRVYSVLSENLDLIYPSYSKQGEILLGYTGYLSDDWIDSWEYPKPHHLRNIDVSYRTHDASKNRCYLRNLKYEIANRFEKAAINLQAGLRLDISNSLDDLIPGKRWHEFVEDSRFCLTTPSGSSLLDPWGNWRKKVIEYCRTRKNASFEEVSEALFHESDRRYEFTAISPRNIEAALAETVQIATKGSYSNLMKPMESYIPLNEDCSNISDVLAMMGDKSLVSEIQKNAKQAMLGEKRLRRAEIVREIISFAEDTATSKGVIDSEQSQIEKVFRQYEISNAAKSSIHWTKSRIKKKMRDLWMYATR